jgi:hypothetical protein
MNSGCLVELPSLSGWKDNSNIFEGEQAKVALDAGKKIAELKTDRL